MKQLLLLVLTIIVITSCGEEAQNPEISISLTAPNSFLPGIGSTLQLLAEVSNGPGDIIFSSNQEEIATVDNTGLVTAIQSGIFLVTASVGDVSKDLTLEVYPVSGLGTSEFDIKFIENVMKAGDFPGAAVAVVKNGKLVHARGYGLANPNENMEVVPESLFRLASVSKPITGVATLKLIENGELNLTDKLFDIIPEFLPTEGPEDDRILDITIDDLLHHKGGWDRNLVADPLFQPRNVAGELGVPSPPTMQDYVRWIATQPLQFTPSEKFSYHNFNYMLLGRVIEKKKGSYEDYVINEMFTPMGLSKTRIGKTREEDRFDGEVAYHAANSGPSNFDGVSEEVSFAYGGAWGFMSDASGGWVSNIIELAKFTISIDGDPETTEFLSQDQYEFMITDFGYGYGAGFGLPGSSYRHSGALNGSISNLVLFHNGISYAFLLNSTISPIAVLTVVDDLVRLQNWPDDVDYFPEF